MHPSSASSVSSLSSYRGKVVRLSLSSAGDSALFLLESTEPGRRCRLFHLRIMETLDSAQERVLRLTSPGDMVSIEHETPTGSLPVLASFRNTSIEALLAQET